MKNFLKKYGLMILPALWLSLLFVSCCMQFSNWGLRNLHFVERAVITILLLISIVHGIVARAKSINALAIIALAFIPLDMMIYGPSYLNRHLYPLLPLHIICKLMIIANMIFVFVSKKNKPVSNVGASYAYTPTQPVAPAASYQQPVAPATNNQQVTDMQAQIAAMKAEMERMRSEQAPQQAPAAVQPEPSPAPVAATIAKPATIEAEPAPIRLDKPAPVEAEPAPVAAAAPIRLDKPAPVEARPEPAPVAAASTTGESAYATQNDNQSSTAANASSNPKTKMTALKLAIFLGTLGIHRYYLGYKKRGVLMSIGCALSIVGTPRLFVLSGMRSVNYNVYRIVDILLMVVLYGLVALQIIDIVRIAKGKLLPADGSPYQQKQQKQANHNVNLGPRAKKTTIIMAILLGGLGVHRYYLGYKKRGLLMSIGFGLAIIGFILLGVGYGSAFVSYAYGGSSSDSIIYLVLSIPMLLAGAGVGVLWVIDIVQIFTGKLLPANGKPYQDEVAVHAPANSAPANSAPASNYEALEKLAKLHEQGILTDEVFQQKKNELLSKL